MESVEQVAQGGTVVIRAHGIPLDDLRALNAQRGRESLRVFNATCPEVGRVQALIKRYSQNGFFVIILGSSAHPEVVAHRSFALSGSLVLSSVEEARSLPDQSLEKTLVVAQTTFEVTEFRKIAAILRERCKALVVKESICCDTQKRQQDAECLVSKAEAVVVVGGKTSNNTLHLVALAKKTGKPVHHVESALELETSQFAGVGSVAVLAGASTPNWTVDEVVEQLASSGKGTSIPRILFHTSKVVQLPLAMTTGLSALAIRWALGWGVPWQSLAFPVFAVLGLATLAPFTDPLGLGTHGAIREEFLRKHKRILLSLGIANLLLALGLSASRGLAGSLGLVVVSAIALVYPQRPRSAGWCLRRLPASKDLGQSFGPAFLVVGLPLLQGYHSSRNLAFPAFLGLSGLLLGLNGWRHVQEFQNDQVLGPETLTVALGIRGAKATAMACFVAGIFLLGWLIAW